MVLENPAVREGMPVELFNVGLTNSQATINENPVRINSRLEDREMARTTSVYGPWINAVSKP